MTKYGKHHRGTVYLVVMATAGIVTALGLTGLALARVQRRADQATIDIMDARLAARAGVEYAQSMIGTEAAWRTRLASAGKTFSVLNVGRGNANVTVSDPADGDLTNWDFQSVDLSATGTVGLARQRCTVRLGATPVPLPALSSVLMAGGSAQVKGGVVCGTGVLSANGNVVGQSGTIKLPVRAGGAVSGGSFYSTQASGAAVSAMPAATAFDYYKAVGTEVLFADLAANRRLEGIVLSPTSNPFAKTASGLNPRGIYWIDCLNNDIDVRNCRIVGTLVLLNCSSASVVSGSVSWEPAEPGLPALLVQGSITFQTTQKPLAETDWSINFNPAGTAYLGHTNATVTDKLASQISGLVYVSGVATVSGELSLDGVLITGGNLVITGSVFAIYRDRYVFSAPPGFAASYTMVPVAGSFTQVVE